MAAVSPCKAPWEVLEAPKVSAMVTSLGQALSQILCPCSEQESPEVRMCCGTPQTAAVIYEARIISVSQLSPAATVSMCPENHPPSTSPVLMFP